MLASELLETEVVDPQGREVGLVLDIRARPARDGTALVVEGLVVGRRHVRLFGYERRDEVGPALIARLAHRIHSDTRYALLSELDIEAGGPVRLRIPWDDLHALGST